MWPRNKLVIYLSQYSLWGFFYSIYPMKRGSRGIQKGRKGENEYKAITKNQKATQLGFKYENGWFWESDFPQQNVVDIIKDMSKN